jgi:hypothetical protein
LPKYGAFKATDTPIKSALSRFVKLEIDYPGHFERFVIATNVGFQDITNDPKSLPHIIAVAQKGGGPARGGKGVLDLVRSIRDEQCCTVTLVWDVLARVVLQSELPQFADVERELAMSIAVMLERKDRPVGEVLSAAKALVQLVTDASSKNNDPAFARYFVLMESPDEVELRAAVESKRITKHQMLSAIESCLSTATLLTSGNLVDVSELPTSSDKLEKKMAAGGIPIGEINLARDLKFSAEKLFQEWLYKYNAERTSQLYDHLRLVVTDDCYEAKSKADESKKPYGMKMLARLRENTKASDAKLVKRLTDAGVTYHHMMGVAGILTEECKVWWSDEFDLGGEK